MLKIKLYTLSGGYVTTVSVPPMNPMPKIIGWGERMFVLDGDKYVEDIMWYSIDKPISEENE